MNNTYQINTMNTVVNWLAFSIKYSRFNISIPVTGPNNEKTVQKLVAANFKSGFQFGTQIGGITGDKSKNKE